MYNLFTAEEREYYAARVKRDKAFLEYMVKLFDPSEREGLGKLVTEQTYLQALRLPQEHQAVFMADRCI